MAIRPPSSEPRPHEQIVRDALAHDPSLRERYDTDPDMRAAWDDITTDYDTVDYPDPYHVGRHDDALDMMLDGIGAELVIAWRRIHAEVKQGRSLASAVETWGIRGHPDFEEWFPVTPPPWGDARIAQAEFARLNAEAAAREAARQAAAE